MISVCNPYREIYPFPHKLKGIQILLHFLGGHWGCIHSFNSVMYLSFTCTRPVKQWRWKYHGFIVHPSFHWFTFEEDDRVVDTLSLGALHGRVDVLWDPREHLSHGLGTAAFQGQLVVFEHLVLLQQQTRPAKHMRHSSRCAGSIFGIMLE